MKMICKYCGIVEKPHKCNKSKRNTDVNREDKQIYRSAKWQHKRLEILELYNYICLWSYYVCGKIVVANNVHHIVEITNDSSLAFDDNNLIPLSGEAHNIVHKLYKYNETWTKNLLSVLIRDYKYGDLLLGKYERYNVSPLCLFDKNFKFLPTTCPH